MVKTTFKVCTFLLPIFLVIGLLRIYFGNSFLPTVEQLDELFNQFPSMKDEVKTLTALLDRQWAFTLESFNLEEIWGGLDGIEAFFRALGQTFVGFFKAMGGMFSMIGLAIAVVGAVVTYPIQAVAWFVGILLFAPPVSA